ncbi:hypothetical protein BDV06DRAFT_230867 [Aspergillus oleicola]
MFLPVTRAYDARAIHKNSKGSTGSSLTQTGLLEIYRQLEEHIKRPFVCGGTIAISDRPKSNESEKQTSPPINLVLPFKETAVLQQLEDVLDTDYRKARKLVDKFATTFHPADFSIIENMDQILLLRVSTEMENSLEFRNLHVELYKLNVHSGPSGLFRKHVDTPRSESQIGSLVVCLPSRFKGGKVTVQHAGQSSEFDWSPQSNSAIQWAAFYSDFEHEIETITEGERITLTYNLYVNEPVRVLYPSNNTIQPTSLPLHGYMKNLLSEPGPMKQGGFLGFYCAHAYPHSTMHAKGLLPRGLKGGDLTVYTVLKCLGVEVKVLPVLGRSEIEEEDDEEEQYASKAKGRKSKKAKIVGKELHDIVMKDWQSDGYEDYSINHLDLRPKHAKLALTYIAYGNEASVGAVYSHAAILAVIPPFGERKM